MKFQTQFSQKKINAAVVENVDIATQWRVEDGRFEYILFDGRSAR